MKALERYFPIIDDIKAFEEAVGRPQPLFHLHFRFPKPTTSCAVAFGRMADRNVVEASRGQLQNYLARRSFALKKDQANACDGSSGYVLVRFKNAVMGVGYYDKSERAVASLFPKSRARE